MLEFHGELMEFGRVHPAASHARFDAVLARLTKAPSRACLLSVLQHGEERVENGRFFNDMNETLLEAVLASHPQLEAMRVWTTEDVRNERRGGQRWLNAIVRRRHQEDGE